MNRVDEKLFEALVNAISPPKHAGDFGSRLAYLVNEEHEAKSRQDSAPDVARALLASPVDVAALGGNKFLKNRVAAHQSTATQWRVFFASARAADLLASLVGESAQPPSDEAIDAFVDGAYKLGFSFTDGKPNGSPVRFLVSTMLMCTWPHHFVEFGPKAWGKIAAALGWQQKMPGGPVAAQLRWAANLAGAVADTAPFKAAFKGKFSNLAGAVADTAPFKAAFKDKFSNLAVAGLVWLFQTTNSK